MPPVTSPAPRRLPASQRERLELIRDQMLLDTRAAVERFGGELATRSEGLMDKIWAARKNKAKVRKLCKGFWNGGAVPLADAVSDAVMDAVMYAERYEETLVAYKVSQQRGLPLVPAAGDIKAIGDYETYFRLNYGAPGARAAIAYAYRLEENRAAKRTLMKAYEKAKREGRTAKAIKARQELQAFDAIGNVGTIRTAGDRLAQQHVRPFKGIDGISKHLHGTAATEGQEMSRVVLRSIREGENVSKAARELQRLVKAEGHKVGAGARQPKVIQQLKEAGRALAKRAGDPDLTAQWKRAIRRIDRYQAKLAPGGTVQNAYIEVLQNVQGEKFQMGALDKVVDRWGYQKQRYQAERIIQSEQSTAMRAEQLEKQRGQSWIIGYRWQMSNTRTKTGKPGLHDRKMKGSGRLKKLGGKRCICEVMDQKILSPEAAREYPLMGHPYCLCIFIEIVNTEAMMSAPISADEDAWYEANFGAAA